MTMPDYIKGITISADGELAIYTDALDAAGVRSVELVEGEAPTPKEREMYSLATEFQQESSRLRDANQRLEAQLAEAQRKWKEKVWDNKPWDWGFVEVVKQLEAQLAEANEALEYKVEIAPDDLLATMLARAQEAEADAARLKAENEWLKEESAGNNHWILDLQADAARLASENERLRGTLKRIHKRTQDCTPLVALDVKQMAQDALAPESTAPTQKEGEGE